METKTKSKKKMIFIVVALVLVLSAIGQNEEVQSDNAEVVEKENVSVEYDALQTLFLKLSSTTTEEEFLSLVEKTDLCLGYHWYHGSKVTRYMVAFSEAVANVEEDGDYLEVCFSNDGLLEYAEYNNHSSNINVLYYNFGCDWNFNNKQPNNEHTGYYSYEGTDIYNYSKASNGKEALKRVME